MADALLLFFEALFLKLASPPKLSSVKLGLGLSQDT